MNATLSNDSLRLLPEHMREAARRYVEEGRPDDDGFIVAVASNDLLNVPSRRPDERRADARLGAFFYAYVPSHAWGSREATDWMAMGGLEACRLADRYVPEEG